MSERITCDQIVPAREHLALKLHHGETLRIIDVEGKQVVDLVALSAIDKGEKLSCVFSNMLNGTWKLTKGHKLYSNLTRPIFSITEDKAIRATARTILPRHSSLLEFNETISTLTAALISS
jgi:uncharacterized protein YcgI (DUF1989 family)